jgi:hypothetical protein
MRTRRGSWYFLVLGVVFSAVAWIPLLGFIDGDEVSITSFRDILLFVSWIIPFVGGIMLLNRWYAGSWKPESFQ